MKKYIGASTLITCVSEEDTIADGYMEIADGRITAIGTLSELPEAARSKLIFYEDCTLLPGFINAHEHLVTKSKYTSWTLDKIKNESLVYQTIRAVRNAQGLLREGVTTLRECGCRERININISRAVKDNILLASDIIACGKPISIIGGHCYYYSWEISSSAEAVRAVRTEIKYGADFIKVHATGGAGTLEGDFRYSQLAFEELTAIIEEAHRHNKRVCSHAIGHEGIRNSIYADVDTVEHGHYLDDELLEEMCARNIHYVPTLTGYSSLAKNGLEMGRPRWMVEKAKTLLDAHQHVMDLIKKYPELVIAAGTDSSGSIAEEIMELHKAGFSNYQVLVFATRNAANALDVLDDCGTLEVGKKANLVVVEGNPLNNIKSVNRIKQVVKNGLNVL